MKVLMICALLLLMSCAEEEVRQALREGQQNYDIEILTAKLEYAEQKVNILWDIAQHPSNAKYYRCGICGGFILEEHWLGLWNNEIQIRKWPSGRDAKLERYYPMINWSNARLTFVSIPYGQIEEEELIRSDSRRLRICEKCATGEISKLAKYYKWCE